MLTIANITLRVPGQILLDDASLSISAGQKIGLIGRNGSGKTSLLRAINGEMAIESGSINMPSNWLVGMTAQEAPDGPASLIDTVMAGHRELADLLARERTETDPILLSDIQLRLNELDSSSAPSRAARILTGLGFAAGLHQTLVENQSGGWRMRVSLAALLFSEPDLLLLDEPTNHLDLESSAWFKRYLKRYRGTVILVSHDRELLNEIPDVIVHLDGGKMVKYTGNYDQFQAERLRRLAVDDKTRRNLSVRREKIEKFVEKFRYKATKARQVQSRLKMLEKMAPPAEAASDQTFGWDFPAPGKMLQPPILQADNLSVGYSSKPILNGLNFSLGTDDRIALVGANGNGKSTLIKLMAGLLPPQRGELVKSRHLKIGYFAQHQLEALSPENSALSEIGRIWPNASELERRTHLGRFGFSQERAETRIHHLSGGEKSRLVFALITVGQPNLLLLDEPSNHFDIDSRQVLTDALLEFAGAIVLVTHDPHLVRLVADQILLVDQGRVSIFDGDMDDYEKFVLENGESERPSREISGDAGSNSRQQSRKIRAKLREDAGPLRRELDRIEQTIERLSARKEALLSSMSDQNFYSQTAESQVKVQTELSEVNAELERSEIRWIELSEDLENRQQQIQRT